MSGAPRPARGPALALLGIAAICQRAYLTLWRQPILIISTMLFPLVYLLVLGNSLNRQLRHIPLAVVDEAGNAESAACRRGVMALETGRELVDATFVEDREEALRGLRHGAYRGVWILPFRLSAKGPGPAFVGDNTDRFSFDALDGALRQVWDEVASGASSSAPPVDSARLEAYPYLDYLTYLGPAVVCLSIFMGSMVSGGLQVLEDRMYGYHEGYLVTPISTGALVTGNVLAGAIVASLAGLLVLGAILMLTPVIVAGSREVAAAVVTVFLTSLAISAVWFLLFARARSVSRAARHVRHHQRAAVLPFRRAVSRRVVSAVAPGGFARGPVDLRPERAAQSAAAREPAGDCVPRVGLPADLRARLRHPDAGALPARDLIEVP